jgi:electron transport complex protein RnfA
MSALAAAIAAAALADNIVLTRMLGLCPFSGLSKRLDLAFGIGLATTFVLTLAAAAAWTLDRALLGERAFLRPLVFIAVIAAIVQFVEIAMRRISPLLHRALGVYLPLIATNCAVLGIALLAVREEGGLAAATARGLGGGLGFALAIVVFAALRARLNEAAIPRPFRGAAIAMITAGLMALAFSGF